MKQMKTEQPSRNQKNFTADPEEEELSNP